MRVSELSHPLGDHRSIQSTYVAKRIHLHLFDVRKCPGRWEERARDGDDIFFKCESVHALLHKSPFSVYRDFALSKVSRLSMVNTLLIETSATIF